MLYGTTLFSFKYTNITPVQIFHYLLSYMKQDTTNIIISGIIFHCIDLFTLNYKEYYYSKCFFFENLLSEKLKYIWNII